FEDPDCSASGLELPVLEYGHDGDCSVTGGHVYRGSAVPEIVGHYFYGDFCGGWVRSFRIDGGVAADEQEWDFGEIGSVLSFGVDAAGELYVLTRDDGGGRVWRFVPAA
ncbi:MAG: PQQ-dependent sugar dehydrogenase, partial [Longimicrobiales bacterium]